MITLGVDAHKQVHVAVALDDAGREIDRWRGSNSPEGWEALRVWAVALGEERQWGIEGAWNYGRGLAQQLSNSWIELWCFAEAQPDRIPSAFAFC